MLLSVEHGDKQNFDTINDNEMDFLQRSMKFAVSGKILAVFEEKKAIGEFNMSKEYVIPIVLNLFGGLEESRNVEEEQEKRIEEEPVNKTFVCEKHGEKTTHYCKHAKN